MVVVEMQADLKSLEQEVAKLSLLVKQLRTDVLDSPWKRKEHPWNQARNPRHLPK